MEGVVKQEWCSFSVNSEDFAFFRINTHHPLLFPQLKVVHIVPQLETVILRVDCQVQDNIICEQMDGGLSIPRRVVNVHKKKIRSK